MDAFGTGTLAVGADSLRADPNIGDRKSRRIARVIAARCARSEALGGRRLWFGSASSETSSPLCHVSCDFSAPQPKKRHAVRVRVVFEALPTQIPSDMARPIGIDLFSGVGGLSLGFEQAGFDVVAAVEYDPIHAAA